MVRMAEKSKPIYLYDSEKAKLVNEETLKLWKRYEIDMTLRELTPKDDLRVQKRCVPVVYLYL